MAPFGCGSNVGLQADLNLREVVAKVSDPSRKVVVVPHVVRRIEVDEEQTSANGFRQLDRHGIPDGPVGVRHAHCVEVAPPILHALPESLQANDVCPGHAFVVTQVDAGRFAFQTLADLPIELVGRVAPGQNLLGHVDDSVPFD